MINKKAPYLPKVRNDYNPTDKEIESGSGVDFPINMPNPAVDSIVSNNIACQEFDYTESMDIDNESKLDSD